MNISLAAAEEHSNELEMQLKKAFDERVDMAKRCVDKDDQVSGMRRTFEETEEKCSMMEEKIEKLLQENIELKEKLR